MKLFVVPTPIGNLEDITFRAISTLKKVDFILAEDTRVSKKLLNHYNIQNTLMSYHMHNEHKKTEAIVDAILAGKKAALISDAGTPGISDPGFLLFRMCIEKGIEIDCLPGANAFVPALVNSGFALDKFVFEGFLPLKKGRKKQLELLASESRTIILYESPHKIIKTLTDLATTFELERNVSISRELTKMYEETIRGTLKELISHLSQKTPKGEYVIIIEGKKKRKVPKEGLEPSRYC